MNKQQIRRQLARPVLTLSAGGFRPTQADNESWLGKVFLFRPEETVPVNDAGEALLPFAQFCLSALPLSSPALENVHVLTLFIARTLPDAFEPMGNSWLIREYGAADRLVRKDLAVADNYLRPFPLRVAAVGEDFPQWDTDFIPGELVAEIGRMRRGGEIESYYDLISHACGHKIGGYPTFCQSGIDAGEDVEFVFQIASDDKINLNVIDGGNLSFWKHRKTGEWSIYYDFY
ncbi:DUF1963 domain-containing protein [Affinibrenneria salicis]|uniref:DUF1963 domain-containing protein n=1 Tax=Affinibrenneria salicis TaxID=2590031 RepID=A0A5J5G1R0_9GAMM|nr:DUF1963 domain-containing protein [Affinibrenneria salicis]KAA9000686.1 DUF1963 domain-containing protein [Affinibrenneria salicis]